MEPSLTPERRRGGKATMPEYHRGKRPPNAGRKFPAEPLEPHEAKAILQALSRRGSAGIRNAALFAVMWRGGLRIAEALALYPKDVDAANCTVRVLHGKRDRDRLAVVDVDTIALVERWLRRRDSLNLPAWVPDGRGGRVRPPLFCQIQGDRLGRPMAQSGVREALKAAAEKAGVQKRVHPHGLRHTHAFELRMAGEDPVLIMQQLGHQRLDTTLGYIDHLAPAERIARLSARSWAA